MNKINSGSLEAFFPRGLVCGVNDISNVQVTEDGLCPLRFEWENGIISNIEIILHHPAKSLNLALPRLIEPHAHIDKSFTWTKAPNLRGTYQGALEANLKEIETRTDSDVIRNANSALKLSLSNGIRALRSHVDSQGHDPLRFWEVLIDLRKKWESLIDLQLVALVPIDFWGTHDGYRFAQRIASMQGLLGGVIVPPFNYTKVRSSLITVLRFADEFGCGLDLHIDESYLSPGKGLQLLLSVLDEMKVSIPITCSHCSSMSLLPPRNLRKLADRLLIHNINVIALPLTNSWLLGRKSLHTPIRRPVAPVSELQQAGIAVGIGGDNVQDPWLPIGNYDPITLMAFSLPLLQLAPWQRVGLAPFTTAAAKIMNLEWDSVFRKGCPADLVLFEASNWSDLLSMRSTRNILIDGQWLNK